MRNLLSQLRAVDPETTDKLQIIAFFDSLLESRAGLEAVLRGAAALAGCAAGFSDPARRIFLRVDEHGRRLEPGQPSHDAPWPRHDVADEVARNGRGTMPAASVWLERPAPLYSSDDMILERCALCLRLTIERSRAGLESGLDEAVVELLLDSEEPLVIRQQAARRAGLPPTGLVVCATPAVDDRGSPRREAGSIVQSVRSTPFGTVLATIHPQEPADNGIRAGIGNQGGVADLPQSWQEALGALRFTHAGQPRVRWPELGALSSLLAAVDHETVPSSDEVALSRLAAERWVIPTVDAIVGSDSLRAAATELGLHHSTMQVRRDRLVRLLGYDLDSPAGRTRLTIALTLYRLRRVRFGDPADSEA